MPDQWEEPQLTPKEAIKEALKTCSRPPKTVIYICTENEFKALTKLKETTDANPTS